MKRVPVSIAPYGKLVEVVEGSTLADAAFEGGIGIATPCAGRGRCHRCVVEAEGNLSELSSAEREAGRKGGLNGRERLACQARVLGEARMDIPRTTLAGVLQILEGGGELPEHRFDPNVRRVALEIPSPTFDDRLAYAERIENGLHHLGIEARCGLRTLQELGPKLRKVGFQLQAVVVGDEVVRLLPPENKERILGAAFDIGTTTVVGYLLDLADGRELAVASTLNPQSRYGADVISRITFAMEHPGGLAILARAVREVMNEIITALCSKARVNRREVYEVVVGGNATMQHLFLKVDPASLAASPYVPVTTRASAFGADSAGIRIHPQGKVFLLPSIGSFLGADTTGVLLATRFTEAEGPLLAMDFGTNVELISRSATGEMYALSAPAGPAFEGGRVSAGLPGVRGAIDHVEWKGGELVVHTIGGIPPVGICGSGLVDVLAVMLRTGAMNPNGLLAGGGEGGPAKAPAPMKRFLASGPGGLEFVLGRTGSEKRNVSVTQLDVRELQLAKGAIAACARILYRAMGVNEEDLRGLFLAGAFGTFIEKGAGQAIGMLPRIPPDRIHPVGNAAGVGAKLVLVSREERKKAESLVREIRVINAVKEPDFEQIFLECMRFQ
jgi:uncharacterized 2Fe-2S/4Fe-4S cluster protein (DUF4445 family)